MNKILQSADILAALQQEKTLTEEKLKSSGMRIRQTASSLTTSPGQAASGIHGVSQFVSNGYAIYNGIRICVGIVMGLRSIFGRRKRRRY